MSPPFRLRSSGDSHIHDSWQDFPIAGEIEKVTGIPTYLENDANLAALAEAVVGEGRDYNYVQFLTISTGLGSGQVINHKIYQGAHGYGHEVAYAPLWRNGPQHGKIYPGGVEAICSGTAITERAKKAGLEVQHAGEVNDMAAFFFSTKRTGAANAIAVSRGIIVKALAIFCIPLLFGSDSIWVAPFAAEIVSLHIYSES